MGLVVGMSRSGVMSEAGLTVNGFHVTFACTAAYINNEPNLSIVSYQRNQVHHSLVTTLNKNKNLFLGVSDIFNLRLCEKMNARRSYLSPDFN